MKRSTSIILLSAAVFLTILASCSKTSSDKKKTTYTCTACKASPEAVAANDASAKGIYIGVLIGSTGTIKFDINNAGTTITAVMVIDGVTVNLTSTVTYTAGNAYVAPFTGILAGQPVTINFSVGATGSSPTITSSNIPGHPNASILIAKETSKSLIQAFEGTYTTTKPETGTFNIILSQTLKAWGAVARKTGSTEVSHGNGTISGADLVDSGNGKTVGTISGDQIDGKFNDSNGVSVTLTGKRTL